LDLENVQTKTLYFFLENSLGKDIAGSYSFPEPHIPFAERHCPHENDLPLLLQREIHLFHISQIAEENDRNANPACGLMIK
jgi:hypothetical protein